MRAPDLKFIAGAGAKFENSFGRGRARGPKLKNLAGAGARPPAVPQRPQCVVFLTLVNLKFKLTLFDFIL